nr:HD domain-containing phosphohydrolase [Desulforadius tongensis]
MNIDYYKLLFALSTALDFTGKGLMKHHIRVALIAQQIARKIGLNENETSEVVCASLLHDIGTINFTEKARLVDFEVQNTYDHCMRGERLVNSSPLLKPLSVVILCHHDRWDGKNKTGLAGESIPLASRIIHLADRVDVLIDSGRYILQQRDEIIKKITSLAGVFFDPQLVLALVDLARRESFWLDLTGGNYERILLSRIKPGRKNVSMEELLSVGEVFARVIDGKSRFTHVHSRLVSLVAGEMAELAGFSRDHCRAMRVAGLLHDLGKLAVPESILEKPGRLTPEEYNIIKCHTYYTYRILEMVEGFEEINLWASYHHECLNGRGYPFGIDGKKLSAESRIMAVSDIFSALVEDRPYRLGLSRHKVEQILLEKVKAGDLDAKWVNLLLENYNQLHELKEACSMDINKTRC